MNNLENDMKTCRSSILELFMVTVAVCIIAFATVACTPSELDPDALAGHWVHNDTTTREREIVAATHIYLEPDRSARMSLELDGLPERTLLLGTWQVRGQSLVLDIAERGEQVTRQVRLPGNGTLVVTETDGSSTIFVRI